LKYKLAVRQAFAQYENRYDDELSSHFLNKRMPEFWKTWAKKFRKNAASDVFIDGSHDGEFVANAFAAHFNKVYLNATGDHSSDCLPLMSAMKDHHDSETNFSNSITVELVDKCIQRLHVGKASGPDNLSSEHLKYVICNLFRTMVTHCLVPDDFWKWFYYPSVKGQNR